MGRKAFCSLLGLLSATVPASGWATKIVGSVAAAPPAIHVPPAAPSWTQPSHPGLASSIPVLPSLVAAAPASPPASPLPVLKQIDVFSSQALKVSSPEEGVRATGSVFDRAAGEEGTVVAPDGSLDPLQLGGLRHSWGKPRLKDRKLEVLGKGSFGTVYAHPLMPSAVIKIMATLSSKDARLEAERERQVGQALARAGAGPQVLGVASLPRSSSGLQRWLWNRLGINDRALVIKERVYGRTVEDMIRKRRFTRNDYELIQRMLERMAQARIRAQDLRTSNIMIGRTSADPEPRAYFMDGDRLLPVQATETREQLLHSLRHQQTLCLGDGGSARWGDNVLDPFEDILQAGLVE